jgi:GDSL-like Lipase/Acylhydrolase family
VSAELSLKTRRLRLLAMCAPGLLVVLTAVGAFLVLRGRSDIGFGKVKLLTFSAVGLAIAGAGALLHLKAIADELARRRGYWRTVAFMILAVLVMPAVMIFAADKAVGLALAANPPGPLLVFPPHYRVNYRTPEFAFTAETNAIGIRDREVELQHKDGFRVLAIGDSYTYGWGVDGATAWPKVLERLLNEQGRQAEVLNLGCPGTSVDAYAVIAERAIPLLKPDLVVVGVLQGDDLKQLDMGVTTDRLFKFNGVAGDEPSGGMLALVLPNFDDLRVRIATRRPRVISAEQIQAEWQRLAKWMQGRFNAEEKRRFEATDEKIKDMVLDGGLNPWDVFYAIQQPDYLAFTLHPEREDVGQAVTKMGSCLAQIKDAAATVNAKVATMAVPAACYACRQGLESRRKVGYRLDDSVLTSDAPDEAIRRACAQAGVAFHSCTAQFRQAGAARDLFFEYDGHFNPEGHAFFAEQLAKALSGPDK